MEPAAKRHFPPAAGVRHRDQRAGEVAQPPLPVNLRLRHDIGPRPIHDGLLEPYPEVVVAPPLVLEVLVAGQQLAWWAFGLAYPGVETPRRPATVEAVAHPAAKLPEIAVAHARHLERGVARQRVPKQNGHELRVGRRIARHHEVCALEDMRSGCTELGEEEVGAVLGAQDELRVVLAARVADRAIHQLEVVRYFVGALLLICPVTRPGEALPRSRGRVIVDLVEAEVPHPSHRFADARLHKVGVERRGHHVAEALGETAVAPLAGPLAGVIGVVGLAHQRRAVEGKQRRRAA